MLIPCVFYSKITKDQYYTPNMHGHRLKSGPKQTNPHVHAHAKIYSIIPEQLYGILQYIKKKYWKKHLVGCNIKLFQRNEEKKQL